MRLGTNVGGLIIFWKVINRAFGDAQKKFKLGRLYKTHMPKPSVCAIMVIFALLGCANPTPKKLNVKPVAGGDKKIAAKPSLNPDTALVCADCPEARAFDPDKGGFDDYVKKHKDYFKGKTKLSDDYVDKHFFSGVDSVGEENIWTYEEVNRLSVGDYISENEFYMVGTVLKTRQFTGIIYEAVSGEGSRKYFTTIDNKGNFISRIILAAYFQHGTYLDDKGDRHPYYTEMSGCVNSDLTIEREAQSSDADKCKIEPDGRIVKI